MTPSAENSDVGFAIVGGIVVSVVSFGSLVSTLLAGADSGVETLGAGSSTLFGNGFTLPRMMLGSKSFALLDMFGSLLVTRFWPRFHADNLS